MFEPFPKIPRLSRECVITEKIDGTNAQVEIVRPEAAGADFYEQVANAVAVNRELGLLMRVGSRTRYITPDNDNFGFAAWVKANAESLWALGEGRHFGEWWGLGIQRGYGLSEKRFSLFNTARWGDDRNREKFPQDRPACCGVVPVLYTGEFSTEVIGNQIETLREFGSQAAPGFMRPEGVIVFHTAASVMFKKTLEKDAEPKTRMREIE